jgi:hypothetical protein
MPHGAPAYRPKLRDVMLPALLAGSTFRDACEAAGLAWSTWKDWSKAVRKGECNDPDIEALVTDAREAHGKSTTALIAQVNVHGKRDWRAAMSLVEFRATAQKRAADNSRAYWEAKIAKQRAKGTQVERTDITSGGKPLAAMTDDELRARLAELEAADAPGT